MEESDLQDYVDTYIHGQRLLVLSELFMKAVCDKYVTYSNSGHGFDILL